MGDLGGFSREDLRYLMMNTTLGVLGTGYDTFATVIVGASSIVFQPTRQFAICFGEFPMPSNVCAKKKSRSTISLILAETNEERQKQIRKFIADARKSDEADSRQNPINSEYNGNLQVTLNDPEDGNRSARSVIARTTISACLGFDAPVGQTLARKNYRSYRQTRIR